MRKFAQLGTCDRQDVTAEDRRGPMGHAVQMKQERGWDPSYRSVLGDTRVAGEGPAMPNAEAELSRVPSRQVRIGSARGAPLERRL